MLKNQRTNFFQNKMNHRVQSARYYWVLVVKWTILSLLIALSIGTGSALFLASLDTVTSYRIEYDWLIWLLPLGGLSVGVLYHYFGQEVKAGNNTLIDAYNQPTDRIIPFKMAPFIVLGTLITHLLGGSAGREGTALQMAGAIADQFTKPFQLTPSERKTLLTLAVAGGFGSVFGTPFAGAIFALEFFVIHKSRLWALLPAVFTALVADFVTKTWGIEHINYPTLEHLPGFHISTILITVGVGILFGLCAAAFTFGLHHLTKVFNRTIAFMPFRPVIGGFCILGLTIVIGNTDYLGLGIPIIQQSFIGPALAYVFALKILFTLITLGSGFKGGEVTPLFFIGATLGSALALWLPLPVALLAAMGFVAVFAGATNTPIACSVMGIELFGLEGAMYFIMACFIAYLFSGKTSIYSHQLLRNRKWLL